MEHGCHTRRSLGSICAGYSSALGLCVQRAPCKGPGLLGSIRRTWAARCPRCLLARRDAGQPRADRDAKPPPTGIRRTKRRGRVHGVVQAASPGPAAGCRRCHRSSRERWSLEPAWPSVDGDSPVGKRVTGANVGREHDEALSLRCRPIGNNCWMARRGALRPKLCQRRRGRPFPARRGGWTLGAGWKCLASVVRPGRGMSLARVFKKPSRLRTSFGAPSRLSGVVRLYSAGRWSASAGATRFDRSNPPSRDAGLLLNSRLPVARPLRASRFFGVSRQRESRRIPCRLCQEVATRATAGLVVETLGLPSGWCGTASLALSRPLSAYRQQSGPGARIEQSTSPRNQISDITVASQCCRLCSYRWQICKLKR